MAAQKRILFLTSCPLVWGGSEELWAGAAVRLQQRGLRVFTGRSESWGDGRRHPRWQQLRAAGVGVNNFSVSGLGHAVPDAFRRFLPRFQGPVLRLRALTAVSACAATGQARVGAGAGIWRRAFILPPQCRFGVAP